MKKLVLFLVLLAFVPVASAQQQYARRIVPLPALPAGCTTNAGDILFLTTGNIGMYQCIAGTYRNIGLVTAANSLLSIQGALVASAPFVLHTATWNNGAVTFVNFDSTVTDTASAAASLLARFTVGANPIFTVNKTGTVTTAAAGIFNFLGRSQITSPADNIVGLINAGAVGFNRLNLGLNTAAFPGITVSPAAGGFSQGVIITMGDGTLAVFANLGVATNGSIIYCSDCTITNPCAGAGAGAIAKRLNGIWVCN